MAARAYLGESIPRDRKVGISWIVYCYLYACTGHARFCAKQKAVSGKNYSLRTQSTGKFMMIAAFLLRTWLNQINDCRDKLVGVDRLGEMSLKASSPTSNSIFATSRSRKGYYRQPSDFLFKVP
jgi:hypothetical protein